MHESGYIPAAALVHIIQLFAHDTDITLPAAVQESMVAMKEYFSAAKYLDTLLKLMKKAIDLSSKDMAPTMMMSGSINIFIMITEGKNV